MNPKILLLLIPAAIISSCSTTYRSGQTPDDVYYSPAKPVESNYKEETKKTTKYEHRDRQLVMSIYDARWRDFDDDYDASYDPYRYGYTCGYYYNPYYYPSPVYISGAAIIDPKNTTPRMTNLGSYNYSNMVVVNPKTGATTMVRSTRRYNNSNTDQSYIRRILAPTYSNTTNNSSNSTYQSSENNTRTYSPSSSGSSGSSGRSTGAPVSRPGRGG